MSGALARSGISGLGEQGTARALAALLSLTTDAVIVFDDDGTITLANERAECLFRMLPGTLVDADVRLLFPPAPTLEGMNGPVASALPFPLDGSSAAVVIESARQSSSLVHARCEPLGSTSGTYLLVAHEVADDQGGSVEDERMMEELLRANRRLSGTLQIVLGTLDSLDIGTLFSRVLGEIAQTMDAWAVAVYMAEPDGYRLRGTTDNLADVPMSAFMSYEHPLASLVAQSDGSRRLRVVPLGPKQLRAGDVERRELLDEDSGVRMEAEARTLPPFVSFVAVPVWFGGHVIALMEVGWRGAYHVGKDDLRLLDAVAEYLSVQLAGAFAAFRAQHAEALDSLGSSLLERLLSVGELDLPTLDAVFREAGEGIGAECVTLRGNAYQRTTIADLPGLGIHYVPLDLAGLLRGNHIAEVCDVHELDGMSAWLAAHGEPSRGVLASVGQVGDTFVGYLMLRDEEHEPFEDVDLAFLRRLLEDAHEVDAGERARSRDKHIAQALQRGMRNELQRVDGLSTQSCYSSATEAAFVGGDFYDLIRLPERRACVIMGDVSGKGVEAASVSSAVKTALGAYAWEGLRPARMVGLLNDFLLGFSRLETFATMFVGMLDLGSGQLAYCSAGHPPALLVRARTGELLSLGVQSGVVGAFEGMRYVDGSVDVEAGDVLLLYTDGVTEARDAKGAFFGEEGLREAVAREAALGFDGLCDRVLGAVERFTGNRMDDDVALVVVRFDVVGSSDDEGARN